MDRRKKNNTDVVFAGIFWKHFRNLFVGNPGHHRLWVLPAQNQDKLTLLLPLLLILGDGEASLIHPKSVFYFYFQGPGTIRVAEGCGGHT